MSENKNDIEIIERFGELRKKMFAELDKVIVGQSQAIELLMTSMLSGGHCLLMGVPGLAKTLMISTLARVMELSFSRIQFTPDLMPSDITGTDIIEEDRSTGRREFRFVRGPVFANIVLADEINRTPPKTQAALLQAMQEHHVTAGGTTHELPKPFFVLATQNPIEQEGTYPLPEAQLDRFLFKLAVHSADVNAMEEIISNRRRGQPPQPQLVCGLDELRAMFAVMDEIFLPRPVARYIARLVAATHAGSAEAAKVVNDYVSFGASPRAAIAMAEAARAQALLDGRPSVGFDDVKLVTPAVLNHRLILNYKARFDKVDTYQVIRELLKTVDETGINLPADVVIDKEVVRV